MNKQALLLPAAIIIAGLIIAMTVYIVRSNAVPAPVEGDVSLIRPVSPEEHLLGNPAADVTIVTYSDLDCAYCKQMQRTMRQLMTEYGAEGSVAWVYRHFPLVTIHPNAGQHAEATECVASLGDKDDFWLFIDQMHATAPSDAEFDPTSYTALLPQLGIDEAAFTACLKGGKFVKNVEADLTNALDIGATATPYNVILVRGADPIVVSGAIPYLAMQKVIDEALARVVK